MKSGITCAVVAMAWAVAAGGANGQEPASSFHGLGFLPDADPLGSSATAVSADGKVVVGWSRKGDGALEAIHWEDGSMTRLGTLTSGLFYGSEAYAVNADGSVIVGIADRGSGADYEYVGVRWRDNILEEVLPDSANSWISWGVNDDGSVIAGGSYNASLNPEATVWRDGVRTLLGSLPGDTSSLAHAVSADGSVIVGMSREGSTSRAVRWANGTALALDMPAGITSSEAHDVSADGSVVVGWAEGAFRWEDEVMTSLRDQPNGTFTIANGTSADGSVVVGRGEIDFTNEAVIWDRANGMRLVRDLLTDSGLERRR